MAKPFTGGCVCGAVRYECRSKPLAMFNCHCETCQKVSGGPYVPVVLVLAKAFKVTQGQLRYHNTDSVSGRKNKRGFCPDCGSRITGGDFDGGSRFFGITASSLDDPNLFHPEFDIFTAHAQVWDFMNPKLPKHTQYAPQ